MGKKVWFIARIEHCTVEVISKPLESEEEARSVYDKLSGNYCICETIYGG